METGIEKMYMNLNELLQDICAFLTNDKLRVLLPKEKKLAESLIDRCKVQLHEISKIQETPVTNDYVDMKGTKVLVVKEDEEDGKNNIYSSVDDNSVHVEATIIEEAIVYPYKDLPAKKASQKIKDGTISMRRRFLLGFEKMKRVYAVIHYQWLLIYGSDKDLKPIFMFDLKNYEAKADNERSANFELTTTKNYEAKADGERSSSFESMNTPPNKKVYYFMANTRKDMIQWVVQINKYHNNSIFPSYELELNGDMDSINEEDDDVEQLYDSVNPPLTSKPKDNDLKYKGTTCDNLHLVSEETVKRNQQNRYNFLKRPPDEKYNPGPPLPGRPTKIRSIPVAPPIVKLLPIPPEKLVKKYENDTSDDVMSDVTYYEDSDEDNTYEVFTNVIEDVKKLETAQETDKSMDEDKNKQPVKQAPRLPVKPKVKPPVARKPSAAQK